MVFVYFAGGSCLLCWWVLFTPCWWVLFTLLVGWSIDWFSIHLEFFYFFIYIYIVKPRFKTTPKLGPLHHKDHHFKVPFHWFLLYLYSIVRPPHYKDHFSSDQVVVSITECYCIYIYIWLNMHWLYLLTRRTFTYEIFPLFDDVYMF